MNIGNDNNGRIEKWSYSVSVVIEHIIKNEREDLLDELSDEVIGDTVEEIVYIREFLRLRGRLPTLTDFKVNFTNFVFYDSHEGSLADCIAFLKANWQLCTFLKVYDKMEKLFENGNVDKAMSVYMSSLDTIARTFDIRNKVAGDRAGVKELYRQARKGNVYIPLGLEGFDDVFKGFNARGDELSILVARTGEGKTWLLLKMYLTALKNGYRAGFYSPEMSIDFIQMRLDTLLSGIPLRKVMEGSLDEGEYERFKEVDEEWKTIEGVGHLFDKRSFSSMLTVADFDKIIRKFKLNILFIDGFKYITDIRTTSRTPLAERMTNVAEDLSDLSARQGIPIVCSIQSNRGGVDKNVPALENIKDSDGVAHNATNVFSMKNKYNSTSGKTEVEVRVIKSRHSFIPTPFLYEARFGIGELIYQGQKERSLVSRTENKPRSIKKPVLKTGMEDDNSDVHVYSGRINVGEEESF